MRLTVKARLVGAAAVLSILAALVVYGFAMRTGRYQVAHLDTSLYVILDTATGAAWVYRAHVTHKEPGKPKVEFRIEDSTAGLDLLERLRP